MDPRIPHARRSIRVRLADVPGSLESVTAVVARHDVNVVRLEVASWDAPDVWDDIELSARRDEHIDAVIRSLRDTGMTVIGLPRAWVMRDWAMELLDTLEHLAMCRTPAAALMAFAHAATRLTQTSRAFVLMKRPPPDPSLSAVRVELLHAAAAEIDPALVSWSGEPGVAAVAVRALTAARSEVRPRALGAVDATGAVVAYPAPYGEEAILGVVGDRPPFLEPELKRLDMFARVAAPHLAVSQVGMSA